jgi:hypothetical protein
MKGINEKGKGRLMRIDKELLLRPLDNSSFSHNSYRLAGTIT